jgi:hypothetical protein
MKTRLLTPVCVLLALTSLSAREFTDAQGRKLDAEIVSAAAGQVSLKRVADGRLFNVPAATFTEADQKFIAEWAAANTKYSFDVTYTKKKLGEVKSKRGAVNIEDETWIYKISVKNRLPTAVGDLRVDYWCFRREDGGKGKGAARIETSGSSKIDSITGSGTVMVDTSEIILHKEMLDGGWYYADGTKNQQSDGMGGLAVRIFDKNGKEILKWATKDDLLAAAVGKTMSGGSNSERSASTPK